MAQRGPAYAYNTANGASAAVDEQTFAGPVAEKFVTRRTITTRPTGELVPVGGPMVVENYRVPEPAMPNRSGLVWGIAILALFIFIFCVTIIILLFTISFENNQIASSILAGLSALFVIVMVGLTFRLDRMYGIDRVYGAGPMGEDETEPVVGYTPPPAVYAQAPMPAVAIAAPPMAPAIAVETPVVSTAATADVGAAPTTAPPTPEQGGYYYGGHPHYGGNIRYGQPQPYYYR